MTTIREALEFFKAHSEWLAENWSLTPEGREYKARFDAHVAALTEPDAGEAEPVAQHQWRHWEDQARPDTWRNCSEADHDFLAKSPQLFQVRKLYASPAPRAAGGVWQPVTEVSPPLNERVQFWCDGGWCYGRRIGENKWLDYSDIGPDDEPATVYGVELWQPMPAAPKSEQGEKA